MTYGYVRVSTDKQRVDNQEFEIQRFCKINNIIIDEWVRETISGIKVPEKRKLGGLLEKIQKDDLIICSELSRLGRSLLMVMSILNKLLITGARVWTIKDNYRLGDDIQSQVLAFAFGLSAQIERDLISKRTKEALALKVAEGVIMGRPRGKKNNKTKLTDRLDEVKKCLQQGLSVCETARRVGVHRITLTQFIIDNDLEKYKLYTQNDKRGIFRGKLQKPKIFEVCTYKKLEQSIKAGMTFIDLQKKYGVHHASIRKVVFNDEHLFSIYKKYHSDLRKKHNKNSGVSYEQN